MKSLTKFRSHVTGLFSQLVALVLVFAICQTVSAQHGDTDPTFATGMGADGIVRSIVELSGGRLLVAGSFSNYNGVSRNGLAVLNEDGSLDMAFDPGSGVNGTVHQAIAATSGRILIVGSFTDYNGATVGNIAMVNSDGSLDTGFRTGDGADGVVHAVASTGFTFVIGGSFSSFDGQARENFAILESDGELDRFANPSVNGTIRVIAVDSESFSSRIVIGGDFTEVGGITGLQGVAMFDSYGYGNYFFRPRVGGGSVQSAVLVPGNYDSRQLAIVGGDFKTVGGFSQAYLGAFDRDGYADPYFNIHPNGAVHALAMNREGDQLLIAGAFTEVNGVAMRGIARLTKRTSFDFNFGYGSSEIWELDQDFGDAGKPDAAVHAVLQDSQERYLIGGDFTQTGASANNRVARLLSPYGLSLPEIPLDPAAEAVSGNAIRVAWDSSANARSYRLELSMDGVSGWEEIRSTSSTSHIASGLDPETEYHFRVRANNANGFSAYSDVTVATTPEIWTGAGSVVAGTAGLNFASSSIYGTAVQPDGKILITGYFSTVLGFERKYVARLNADRTLDTGFDTGNLLTSLADDFAIAPDGKIYVVSNSFSSVLGLNEYGILRLNPDGTHDPGFTPPKGRYKIRCVEIDALGNVLLGLNTETFGNQSTGALVRLKPDGSIDDSLQIFVDSSVEAIGFHPDRRIVAAGSIHDVNDTVRRDIMRCDPLGVIDTTVGNTSTISSINALEALPDGSIVIAGSFTSVYGETRSRIAKLNPNGTLDTSFVPPEFSSSISEIERLPGGKFLVAGSFTTVGGKYMPRIARLDASGAIDPDFRIGIGPSSTIQSISLASDGSLVVAGSFFTFNSESTRYLAFLKGDPIVSAPGSSVLTAAGVGIGHLDISWDDQEEEFGYIIEFSANGTDGWTEAAQLGRNSGLFRTLDLAPGETRFFRIRATNGLGTSAFSNIVSATAWTRFQAWNVDKGFAFDTPAGADGDGDGMGQLMEYGLGLDPETPDSDGALSTQMIGGNLVLTYYESRPELIYRVEVSDDLSTWSTEGVSVFHGNFSMGWAPVVEPSRFLRLCISEE